MLNFAEVVDKKAKRPVSDWVADLSEANQEKAEAFMRLARGLSSLAFPHFRKYQSLYETRWRGAQRVPHRIFCYEDRVVILLRGCTHKDNVYKPKNAYKMAERSRKEIEKDEATTCEFTLGAVGKVEGA